MFHGCANTMGCTMIPLTIRSHSATSGHTFEHSRASDELSRVLCLPLNSLDIKRSPTMSGVLVYSCSSLQLSLCYGCLQCYLNVIETATRNPSLSEISFPASVRQKKCIGQSIMFDMQAHATG